MSGTLQRRLNYGIQNQHIQDVIEKRGISSEGMIQYSPHRFDIDIYYTNKVLRNVLGDSCYSWANPFSNSRNSFGKPQYYREQKFPFMLIGNKDEALQQLTQPVTRSPNELVTCALRSGGVWVEDLCTVRSSTTKSEGFWDHYIEPVTVYHEYLLDDIEWFSDHAILWFNRNFKVFSEMNKNFNFSCSPRPHFIIDNTYTEPHEIEIVAVNFDLFSYGGGVSGMRYIG